MRAGAGPRISKRPRRLPRKQLARHRGSSAAESRALGHALVCAECGQLGWPSEGGDAQPHRRDAVETTAYREPCSHCGERSWIDLGRESTALMLRQHDEDDVDGRGLGGGQVVRDGAVGAVVGAAVGIIVLYPSVVGVLVMAFLVAMLSGAWSLRQHQRHAPRPTSLPARWAMALAPAGPVAEVVSGPVHAAGELLTAPLSGRRCVAYEVGLRHDGQATAAASTWALLEQRVAPLGVGAQRVEPPAVHLALARERLGARSTVALDEAAEAFLRQRGFGARSTELELFETIIEPDATVQLELTAHGATLRRESSSLVRAGDSP